MRPWKGLKNITIVSACHNANGSPDFAITTVACTHEQVELGQHYDLAEDELGFRGYDMPFVHFDPWEIPKFLLPAVRRYLKGGKP